MSTTIREKFIEAFTTSDAIEVDGAFCRHYEADVYYESDEPDASVVDFTMNVDGDEKCVIITEGDLESATLCDEGNTWSIGDYEIQFFMVTQVSTNPVDVTG